MIYSVKILKEEASVAYKGTFDHDGLSLVSRRGDSENVIRRHKCRAEILSPDWYRNRAQDSIPSAEYFPKSLPCARIPKLLRDVLNKKVILFPAIA